MHCSREKIRMMFFFFGFIKCYIHIKARLIDRFVGQISVETNLLEEVLKDSTKMGLINPMFGHLVCGSSRELFSILIGTKYESILIGMIHPWNVSGKINENGSERLEKFAKADKQKEILKLCASRKNTNTKIYPVRKLEFLLCIVIN